MRAEKNILTGILFIGVILLLNACVVTVNRPYGQVQPHTTVASYYWYYYPSAQVYYHLTERYYYYPDGGVWRKTNHLPPGWVISKNDRVLIKIAGMPYTQHAYHQQKYPAKNRFSDHTHRYDQPERENHSHPDNGHRPDGHPVSRNNDHMIPPKSDHAAQGHANGKQQPSVKPGFSERVKSGIAGFGKSASPGHENSEENMPPGHVMHDKQTPPGHGKQSDAPDKSHLSHDSARHEQMSHEHGHEGKSGQVAEKFNTKDGNRGAGNEERDNLNKRQLNRAENNNAGRDHIKTDNRNNTNSTAGTEVDKITKPQKEQQQPQQRGVAKADQPANANVKSGSSKDKQGNKKGKADQKAKQTGADNKGKKKAGNNAKDDTASDSDKDNTEDKGVELDTDKGKGKIK